MFRIQEGPEVIPIKGIPTIKYYLQLTELLQKFKIERKNRRIEYNIHIHAHVKEKSKKGDKLINQLIN